MIESQTPAVQLALTGKTRIAVTHLERFAQREDPITAAQAKPIDDALQALSAALLAAGVGGAPVDPKVAPVTDGQTVVAKSSGVTVPGTTKAKVVNSVLTEITLPATVAPLASGVLPVAATGTGTKVTLTVAAGKVTAVTLSA